MNASPAEQAALDARTDDAAAGGASGIAGVADRPGMVQTGPAAR